MLVPPLEKGGLNLKKYQKRTLSVKWKLTFHKKEIEEDEFRCIFSDFIAKGIFGREDKKEYLALLLSDVFKETVDPNDLTFYKNNIGIEVFNTIAFQCDIVVFYKDILLILEFNSSSEELYVDRNQAYQFLTRYQLLKAKKDNIIVKANEVWLINFNNFFNSKNKILMDYFSSRNEYDQLLTEKVKTFDIYLPIGIKKFYNDGVSKEKLSNIEKLVVMCYDGHYESAKKIVEGSDILMCILDDLMTLSHSRKTTEYYQSMEDAITESRAQGFSIGEKRGEKRGIAIGEKRGRTIGRNEGIAIGEERGIAIGKECGRTLGHEEAYMEMMKQLQELNVSKEIIEQLMKTKKITKSLKK